MSKFLTITDTEIAYHETAADAVKACGIPMWERALPIVAVQALNFGDELSLTPTASVFRLTGVDVDYAS